MRIESVGARYRVLTETLISRGLSITTMESCTSGQIASLITDTEGSSAVFKGAFVTYSNEAKVMNGVSPRTIAEHGVYSVETASEMAVSCRERFGADIGVGVTGSFGNADPANGDSVPGRVFFAISTAKGTECHSCTVPEQDSRLDYKLYMASVVVDRLLAILT